MAPQASARLKKDKPFLSHSPYQFVVTHRMKRLAAILIFTIPLILSGQESIEPILKVKGGVWWRYAGAYLTPEIAFRSLENHDNSQSSQRIIEFRNDRDTYKFGYTNGVTIGYIYKKNFGFETGFSYSNLGYRTDKIELTTGGIIDPRRGFELSEGDSPSHVRLVYHFEYIGIPLALKYLSGDWLDQWRFTASAGCTANYLVRARSTVVKFYDDDSPERSNQTSNSDYEKLNLVPFLSAGIDYQLNTKMRLSAMPTFRYGALDIIDAPITEKLFSGGIQFGWYLNL